MNDIMILAMLVSTLTNIVCLSALISGRTRRKKTMDYMLDPIRDSVDELWRYADDINREMLNVRGNVDYIMDGDDGK